MRPYTIPLYYIILIVISLAFSPAWATTTRETKESPLFGVMLRQSIAKMKQNTLVKPAKLQK